MFKLLLAAAMALICLSTASQAEVQKCVMQVGDTFQGDMIAKEIYLIFDGDDLMVMDNLVNFFNKGKPIKVRDHDERENRRSFEWAIFIVNKTGQRTKMLYVATYFPGKKELHVLARPTGYNNKFSATGKCQIHNG